MTESERNLLFDPFGVSRGIGINSARTLQSAVGDGGRTAPRGYADIAPSRFVRIEGDGYLTIDAAWIVPMLLRTVAIEGRVLEPAAGQGHLTLELKRAGLEVTSFDIRRYEDPLVPDIGIGDIRQLESLADYDWVVSNLPYESLTELTAHLTDLAARDRCGVALIVRSEWLVPKARAKLIHRHPHFAGAVMMTKRPRWAADGGKGPRHNFAWCVWSASPRVGDAWIRFASLPSAAPASEARPSLIHP